MNKEIQVRRLADRIIADAIVYDRLRDLLGRRGAYQLQVDNLRRSHAAFTLAHAKAWPLPLPGPSTNQAPAHV